MAKKRLRDAMKSRRGGDWMDPSKIPDGKTFRFRPLSFTVPDDEPIGYQRGIYFLIEGQPDVRPWLVGLYQHFFKSGEDKWVSIACSGDYYRTSPKKLVCPFCELADELWSTGSDSDKQKGRRLDRKLKVLMVGIDLDKKKVVNLSMTQAGIIKAIDAKINLVGGDWASKVHGRNILIYREGEGLSTRYTVEIDQAKRPKGVWKITKSPYTAALENKTVSVKAGRKMLREAFANEVKRLGLWSSGDGGEN